MLVTNCNRGMAHPGIAHSKRVQKLRHLIYKAIYHRKLRRLFAASCVQQISWAGVALQHESDAISYFPSLRTRR